MVGCRDCEKDGHGQFTYPQHLDGLQYNFKDTLLAEWTAVYNDSLDCDLSMWWYVKKPWRKSFSTRVPCNGSQEIPLNIATHDEFKAQLNLNHTYPNGSNNLLLSSFFYVNQESAPDPITWKSNGPTASLSTGAPTVTKTSSPSSATQTTAPETQPSSVTKTYTRISGGAIAGIVLSIVLGLALLAVTGFFLWRRRRKQRQIAYEGGGGGGTVPSLPWTQTGYADGRMHPGQYGQPVSEKPAGHRVVEMAARPRTPAELDAWPR